MRGEKALKPLSFSPIYEMALIERTPMRSGLAHTSTLRLVLRDGITGEIKAIRESRNAKLLDTYNLIFTSLCAAAGTKSLVWLGFGTDEDWATGDNTLTGEIGADGGTGGRTAPRVSHDADSERWSLSWSYSEGSKTHSIAQAGIWNTGTGTDAAGGFLFLKATFARLTLNTQDVLNVAWTQSIASA